MGNVGNTLNSCGITDTIGFGRTTAGIIRVQGIQPWPARELVKENLKRQSELARRSPLNRIPVDVGMNWFKDYVGGWFNRSRLTREVFVDRATELLVWTNTRHTQSDRFLLYDIFDSMDYDENGELSIGEWGGGLTVFFKGNMEECIHAVFDVLDTNGDKSLSKAELSEYLKPFVNAMTPPEAASLRPLLTKKAADDIFAEMDFDHNDQISSDEMLLWSRKGNNIVDRIANIMDHEVYSAWLTEKDREGRQGYANGGRYGDGQTGYNQTRPVPAPRDRQAWDQGPNRGQPYGGAYGEAQPYGGNYGGPPPYGGNYGGGGYGQPPPNDGGYNRPKAYTLSDPNDYRGFSSQTYGGHGFMNDIHHDSAFGGGY